VTASQISSEHKSGRLGEKAEQRLRRDLTRFSCLPDDALVDVRVLAAIQGCSVATVWRDVSRGRLPRPQRSGARSRWTAGVARASLRG